MRSMTASACTHVHVEAPMPHRQYVHMFGCVHFYRTRDPHAGVGDMCGVWFVC